MSRQNEPEVRTCRSLDPQGKCVKSARIVWGKNPETGEREVHVVENTVSCGNKKTCKRRRKVAGY